MPKRSVRYEAQFTKSGDRDRRVPVGEAVKLLKEMGEIKPKKSYKGAKARKGFDQTVEVVLHLGIDPKQADQMIRGAVSLPKGIGKTKKVIAFCPDDVVEAAK